MGEVHGDRVLVDDVAVIRAIPEEEATKTLMECRDKMFVYHTGNDSVVIELRRRPGLRGQTKKIERMVIDTGAAHTIIASDAVVDIGIFL